LKRILGVVGMVGLTLITASAAWAQSPAAGGGIRFSRLLEGVVSTAIYSFLGIVLAIVGFKLFDAAIPFSLEREICEKNNIAVAILAAAMILGICLIVGFVVIAPS